MQVIAVQPDIVWHDKDANHAKVRQLLSGQSFTEDALIASGENFLAHFFFIIVVAHTDGRIPLVGKIEL